MGKIIGLLLMGLAVSGCASESTTDQWLRQHSTAQEIKAREKYQTASIKNSCGCPTIRPTEEELKNSNYGTPISQIDAQKQVMDFLNKSLKDPYSAQIKWGVIKKGWLREVPIDGCNIQFGYIFAAEVNAKNSFGGYVGHEPYDFFFRDGVLISINESLNSGIVVYGFGDNIFTIYPDSLWQKQIAASQNEDEILRDKKEDNK